MGRGDWQVFCVSLPLQSPSVILRLYAGTHRLRCQANTSEFDLHITDLLDWGSLELVVLV